MKAMQETMYANHAEIMAEIRAWRKEKADQEAMKACLGKTEATDMEANPEEIVSKMEHEKVPKEDAIVKSAGGLWKRHRGRNLAAERHQKLEEGTWGNCGSWKKLATAHRGMTCHTGVAGHKVQVIRKNQTRDKAR
jgi:hypothetical protein